jgi:hypothetical protein
MTSTDVNVNVDVNGKARILKQYKFKGYGDGNPWKGCSLKYQDTKQWNLLWHLNESTNVATIELVSSNEALEKFRLKSNNGWDYPTAALRYAT